MKEEFKLYIAALGGAFFLVIADLMSNIDAATTLKLGAVLEKFVLGETVFGPGLIGLTLVLLISVFFCWLYNPEDKVAAFTRGLSVFAVLSAVTPYSIVNDSSATEQNSPKPQQTIKKTSINSLIPSAYADETQGRLSCKSGILEPDSKLTSEKNVSSCKPYYSGLLGLGSFFNNTIEYCWSNHTLKNNENVKLLQRWETGLRGYRYSQIEFQKEEEVCTGWVSDGRKAIKYVVPN